MERLQTSSCVSHGYYFRNCSETNLFFRSFDIIYAACIQFGTLSDKTILLATLVLKYRCRCEKVQFPFPCHEGMYGVYTYITYSRIYQMQLSGQHHSEASLSLGNNPGSHRRRGYDGSRGSEGDLETRILSVCTWLFYCKPKSTVSKKVVNFTIKIGN